VELVRMAGHVADGNEGGAPPGASVSNLPMGRGSLEQIAGRFTRPGNG